MRKISDDRCFSLPDKFMRLGAKSRASERHVPIEKPSELHIPKLIATDVFRKIGDSTVECAMSSAPSHFGLESCCTRMLAYRVYRPAAIDSEAGESTEAGDSSAERQIHIDFLIDFPTGPSSYLLPITFKNTTGFSHFQDGPVGLAFSQDVFYRIRTPEEIAYVPDFDPSEEGAGEVLDLLSLPGEDGEDQSVGFKMTCKWCSPVYSEHAFVEAVENAVDPVRRARCYDSGPEATCYLLRELNRYLRNDCPEFHRPGNAEILDPDEFGFTLLDQRPLWTPSGEQREFKLRARRNLDGARLRLIVRYNRGTGTFSVARQGGVK